MNDELINSKQNMPCI